MGWTDRKEIKTNFEDIMTYVNEMDYFHDYRMGSLDLEGSKARITIEEILPAEHISESTGLVWNFEFENVIDIRINVDTAFWFSIDEVVKGEKNKEICFALHNGEIRITAEKTSLGIPSEK